MKASILFVLVSFLAPQAFAGFSDFAPEQRKVIAKAVYWAADKYDRALTKFIAYVESEHGSLPADKIIAALTDENPEQYGDLDRKLIALYNQHFSGRAKHVEFSSITSEFTFPEVKAERATYQKAAAAAKAYSSNPSARNTEALGSLIDVGFSAQFDDTTIVIENTGVEGTCSNLEVIIDAQGKISADQSCD